MAQVVGPMTGHFYKAVARALEFDGPAVINAYTTCQPEHGVADDMSAAQARLAVESRAFPIFVYDPDAGETLRERLSLQGNPSVDRDWHTRKAKDGGIETVDFASWARTEGRFRKHFDKNGNPSETLASLPGGTPGELAPSAGDGRNRQQGPRPAKSAALQSAGA